MLFRSIIIDQTILQSDKTVNFDNTMSVDDMQYIINNQPKNLNGHNLIFQFADGTYDFGTTHLYFLEFEGGSLKMFGNLNNTLAANGTGLGVKIQSEKTNGNGAFLIEKCSRVIIEKIAFEQNGTNTDTNLVCLRFASDLLIEECSFNNVNGSANTNDGIEVTQSKATVRSCGFNNLSYNILCRENSRSHSQDTFTFSGGTDAYRNLRAETGSIMTQNNTQAGGGDSLSSNSGSVIFDKDGQTT